MRAALNGIMIALGLLLVAQPAAAAQWCDYISGGADEHAVQDASEAVGAGCPCGSFDKPGFYRSCVQRVLKGRVDGALLSKVCARQLKAIILPSTCGYPAGAVACVRFKSNITPGRRTCRIVADESRCVPPAGGGACMSTASCFDAIGSPNGPNCIDG